MSQAAIESPAFRPEDQPMRAIRLGRYHHAVERRPDGALVLSASEPLEAWPERLTEKLLYWAGRTPDRTFIARRGPDRKWIRITYAEALDKVTRLASAFLERGLSPERPIMILSGNGLEHAMIALAALHAGIPYAPISAAYSLISGDFAKLKHIAGVMTPGLVFADDGAAFARAFRTVFPEGVEIVTATPAPDDIAATSYADLLATQPSPAVERAFAAIGPDTVAKILFTSGSTGSPKGVINTQRMICANQVMLNSIFRFLRHTPPILVDWLPWSHTFGGNHNFGIVLFNGGTFYIDDGKPVPGAIEETIRNLREISPTLYFNVPKGYECLVPYLEAEPALRETFFQHLEMNYFAGAGLTEHVWEALDHLALRTIGYRVPMLTGLGSTETAPFAVTCDETNAHSGHVGLPVPGVELKLAPVEGKLEARMRGPSITPGYWRAPEPTAKAFDEEGFYKMGDALKFVDPDDITRGLLFDGRISEDYKLATGTWVSVGPMKAKFVSAFAPFVKEVVLAGINRDDIRVLVFPDIDGCRKLSSDLAFADQAAIAAHPAVRAVFHERLLAFQATATGSSSRVVALSLLAEPPSIDAGEITDKGSINQRAVLTRRAALVEDLYAEHPPEHVIMAGA